MPENHPDDDRFIAYALNELEDTEREAMKVHFRECGRCMQQTAHLVTLLTRFREPAPASAPVSVLVQLLEHQAAGPRRRDWLHSRPLRSIAAGIVVAVLAFSAGYIQAQREQTATERPARSQAGPRAAERKTYAIAPNLIPVATVAPGDWGMALASSPSPQDSTAIRDSM